MGARVWLWIVCAILLTTSVLGSHIDDYEITFTPVKKGIQEEISLTLTPDEDTEVITYTFEEQLKEVYATSGEGSDYEVDGKTLYVFDLFEKGKDKRISISFITSDFIEKKNDLYVFSFTFHPPETISLKVTYILPKDYALAEIDPAISPSPKEMLTDGRDKEIIWQFDSLNESTNFIVLYEKRSFAGVTLGIVLVSIIGIVIILLLLKKNTDSKKVAHGTLDHNELAVVALLSERPERTQKELVKLTNFSKAKMSKIIRKLEQKGVLEKKAYMTTNKFALNKHFKQ